MGLRPGRSGIFLPLWTNARNCSSARSRSPTGSGRKTSRRSQHPGRTGAVPGETPGGGRPAAQTVFGQAVEGEASEGRGPLRGGGVAVAEQANRRSPGDSGPPSQRQGILSPRPRAVAAHRADRPGQLRVLRLQLPRRRTHLPVDLLGASPLDGRAGVPPTGHVGQTAVGIPAFADVDSAAFAARREIPVSISERSFWGIRIPEIRWRGIVRSADARGYSFPGVASSDPGGGPRIREGAGGGARCGRGRDPVQEGDRKIDPADQRAERGDPPEGARRYARAILLALEERERENVFRMKRFTGRVR